jgi:hypothetical protein
MDNKPGVFDRQLRIEDWNQQALSQQVLLILGVGGIGSIVLINVLREGVKKVFIVDYDIVEVHNLNRQLLYNLYEICTINFSPGKMWGMRRLLQPSRTPLRTSTSAEQRSYLCKLMLLKTGAKS